MSPDLIKPQRINSLLNCIPFICAAGMKMLKGMVVVGSKKTIEKNKSMPCGIKEMLAATLTPRDSVWHLGKSGRKYRSPLAPKVVKMGYAGQKEGQS